MPISLYLRIDQIVSICSGVAELIALSRAAGGVACAVVSVIVFACCDVAKVIKISQ